MGRMNIYLSPEEDEKLDKLKSKYNINSKEEVIKRLIKQFPLNNNSEFDLDLDKETKVEDII